jgi:H+/gluconate symporter-like permease
MQLAVSAVLMLGVVLFLLVRKAGLHPFHAAVAVLFGFLLTGTPLDGPLRQVLNSASSVLGGLDL